MTLHYSPTVLLLDVDGTLIDSSDVVIGVFDQVLAEFSYPKASRDFLLAQVGPPLWDSFSALGIPEEKHDQLITRFRAIYKERFLQQKVFPGVSQLLNQLHSAGVPLATATSKQEPMTRIQMDKTGLAPFLDVIAGASPDRGSTKATVVCDCLHRLKNAGFDVSAPLLLGDTQWDIKGAREVGIPVAIAEWGYGTPDTVADADFHFPTPDSVRTFFLG
ncbi:MAG: HAD hydrolase-like protein [Actinomycetaceae bacterium]|nr:HAD hydrolase-like protein [Actinomycetaceae bacterium]